MSYPNYESRSAAEYYEKLKTILDINFLKRTALTNPEDPSSSKKIIRIDFCGISASTLLLPSSNKLQVEVQEMFLKIFEKLPELEKDGYNIRVRFLFAYLYSDFAYALVEAEQSPFRPTMKEKKSHSSDRNLFFLTIDDFKSSKIFSDQRRALGEIERIYNRYFKHPKYKDILNVRFTSLPLNFCVLNVNNNYYIDSYAYAKKDRYSSLAMQMPVIEINQANLEAIQVLEDHFRYMWTHPASLPSHDATRVSMDNKGNLENLNSIKLPMEISFDHKTELFRKIYSKEVEESKIDKWKFEVERVFKSMTRVIETRPGSETLFIGFAFENAKEMCEKVQRFLKQDFNEDVLKVNVVDLGISGKALHEEVICKMEEATLGLMFFTKDMKGTSTKMHRSKTLYYSRPNIHFEYGFLYKHVKKFGNPHERITLFVEDGLSSATDFQDVNRFPYSKNVFLNYEKIIERILWVNKTITRTKYKQTADNFMIRMSEAFDAGEISLKEVGVANKNDYLNRIKGRLGMIFQMRFPATQESPEP